MSEQQPDFDRDAAWYRRFTSDAESNLRAFALRLARAGASVTVAAKSEAGSERLPGSIHSVVAEIEAHDRDLARQLRRASASVALNVSEGSGSHGGTRRERYRNALGSARETGACLDVAVALGYVAEVDSSLLDALDKVRATLVKVAL